MAATPVVLRGATAISIGSNSLFPKLLTQAKGKFQHSNLPLLELRAWELSNNQLEIKSFRKELQTVSQNQEEHLLRKSMMQNGSYTPVGVLERRLIQSRPFLRR